MLRRAWARTHSVSMTELLKTPTPIVARAGFLWMVLRAPWRHTRWDKTHRRVKAVAGAAVQRLLADAYDTQCKSYGPNSIASQACPAAHSDYLQAPHNAALHLQSSDVCASESTSPKALQGRIVLYVAGGTISIATGGLTAWAAPDTQWPKPPLSPAKAEL